MPEPDPLRLRYRDIIASVVKTVVERMEKPTVETIDKVLHEYTYNPADHNALHEMILEEFNYLHEGNVGRYGLTPSQYYKWKSFKTN